MRIKIILPLLILLSYFYPGFAQITYSSNGDTTYITGGTLSNVENAGLLEKTINGDTTRNGTRIKPNRVYALNNGQVYYQLAPINVYNPTGVLSIVGIPSKYGKTKPIILIKPTSGSDVTICNNYGCGGSVNLVYGSLKFVNIHYQTMQLDGYQANELFYCGSGWGINRNITGTSTTILPQSLTIDNCLFEFSNIDLFDCTNEAGAIGGWPHGAKFRITNSYFRNLFFPGQWWGSRVFQCKHPIDTLWVENCTVTTGGLTFLQQNELTDFAYFNHNTIVNNKKYWILSPFYKNLIITNNIFINQNWVGEDTNTSLSGNDPDRSFQSTICIDTNNATIGLVVQQKYYKGDSTHFTDDLALKNIKVYISNNINYYDPQLINGYYKSSIYILPSVGTPPSYLTWAGGMPPFKIQNIPCEWMNSRTSSIFHDFAPPNGGFIEENTSTDDPRTITPGIEDASVVTTMAEWNQNQWGDPRFATPPDIVHSKYIYGDYDPTTLPGKINGLPSDAVTGEGRGIQVGITKFTDFTENFSQSTHISKIDNLPIGALIWDDAKLAAFNSEVDIEYVNAAYVRAGGISIITGTKDITNLPASYSLSQNYPNPFNPTTNINFTLIKPSDVTLEVYNILGQKVATLVKGYLHEGSYTYQFDAKDLASGVYVFRIKAGDLNAVRKMTLIK
jgi:hypothetical protein